MFGDSMPDQNESLPSRPTSDQSIVIFAMATFLLSAFFDYPIFGPHPLSDTGEIFMWLVMWCPGVVALTFIPVRRASFASLGLTRSGGRWLLWAAALPVLLYGPLYVLAVVLGHGVFTPASLAGHGLPLFLILLRALGRALGEEIGWRGYLFPRLRERFSFATSALISGVIWSVWHFAVIVQGAYQDAQKVPLALALPLFTIGLTGESFLYAWLRERSGSVWPAVIIHGVFNWFTLRVMGKVLRPDAVTPWVVGEMSMGSAALGIAIAIALWRGPRQARSPTCG
jgi:membrane protease YdiL (CAAX protease family)